MKHYFRVLKAPPETRRNLFEWLFNKSAVTILIIINIVIFLILGIFMLVFGASAENQIMSLLSLQANNLFARGYIWTLLTSMFLHANFFHLFVNMFSLFFIGRFLEMLIGKKRFLGLYILSGIFSGLFFAFFAYFFGFGMGAKVFGTAGMFAVGASGAIFGIAGVLALLTPRNKVYLIAGPLIAIILQAIAGNFLNSSALINILNVFITIYIFIAIFAMFSFSRSLMKLALPIKMPFWILPIVAILPLVIIGLFVELPIGNMAHLGGFIAGAVYGIYLRQRYKRKTKIISEYFSGNK